MALLPLASGSEARGFWASTAASSIRRVVRRRSPSSASANSWTAQVVSSTRLLIRRSCVQGVIIGRIQGFHAFSIPQDTRKQKLWVTGSPLGEGTRQCVQIQKGRLKLDEVIIAEAWLRLHR